MNRYQFETELRDALSKARVPQGEIDKALAFFAESIADRMDDGMSEEEAVASLGSISDIALQVIQDLPAVPKAVSNASKMSTSTKVLAIILAVVLCPVWIPIAAAVVGVVVGAYLTVWFIIAFIWALDLCLVLAPAAAICFMVYCCTINPAQVAVGIIGLGVSLICLALGILLFLGILWLTKQFAILTGKFCVWFVGLFKKDDGQKAQQFEASQAQAGAAQDAVSGAASAAAQCATGPSPKNPFDQESNEGGVA